MPSRLCPQYQESLHFTRGGQPLTSPVFDRALEVLLAALGQFCREEPHWGHEHLQTPSQGAKTPRWKPLPQAPWLGPESCRNLVT